VAKRLPRAIALIKDASVEEHVASAIAVEEFGSRDVCFANSGISGGLVPFFEEIAERWAQILRINLIGTIVAAKNAALTMTKQRRGSIICTASVTGLRSGAGCMPYSASKSGGGERRIGPLNPLRRAGAPGEIAQMALFLASDAASYVNGQPIAVDGGLSSSLPVVLHRD
jgi:NAD(P)-dependent dehydrogenase (short-subunit alcohol dehydrogenase family)